jgi:hypothetical protein
MDPYTKTGLRLNKSTPLFPQSAPRPGPTSTEEQALLFLTDPQPAVPSPDTLSLPETPEALRKEPHDPKPPGA